MACMKTFIDFILFLECYLLCLIFIEDDQRLLVYEFMPRRSLENHLFRSM